MREKKTEQLLAYPFYDTDGLARHFEKRASQGWILERFDALGYHYRRGEPKALHYTVLLYPGWDGYTPFPTENQEELSGYCAHAGWQRVTVNGSTMIFVNTQPNPVPIHTDPVTALKNLDRVARRGLIVHGVILLLTLFCIGISLFQWYRHPLDLLLEPQELTTFAICVTLALLVLVQLVPFLIYRFRAGRAAREGVLLPTFSLPRLTIAISAFLLFLLGNIFLTTDPSACKSFLIRTLLSILPLLLFSGVNLFLLHMKADAKDNKHLSIGVYVMASLVLFLFLPSEYGLSNGTPLPMLPDPPAVTVPELTGVEDPTYQWDRCLWKDSFLVTESHVSNYSEDDKWGRDTTKPELYYTQLDVHAPWTYKLCLRDTLNSFDWARENLPDLRFIPLLPTPEGLTAAYELNHPLNDAHHYIFCLEDRLIQFKFTNRLTEAQLALIGAAFVNQTTI